MLDMISGFFQIEPAVTDYQGKHDSEKPDNVNSTGYHWERKKQPTGGGALVYAFETLSLAEFTPIGPGVAQRQFFNVLQPPPPYIVAQSVITNNFGGLAAGGLYSLPLIDSYSQPIG